MKNSLPGFRLLTAAMALLVVLLSPPLHAANPPEAASAPATVQLAWDRVGSPVRIQV